jgi:hypothetical protein
MRVDGAVPGSSEINIRNSSKYELSRCHSSYCVWPRRTHRRSRSAPGRKAHGRQAGSHAWQTRVLAVPAGLRGRKRNRGFSEGELWTSNPSMPLLEPMIELAGYLGARVRGDELETYRTVDDRYIHPDDRELAAQYPPPRPAGSRAFAVAREYDPAHHHCRRPRRSPRRDCSPVSTLGLRQCLACRSGVLVPDCLAISRKPVACGLFLVLSWTSNQGQVMWHQVMTLHEQWNQAQASTAKRRASPGSVVWQKRKIFFVALI